jgi:integrase
MGKLKQRPNGYYIAWYHGKQFVSKSESEAKAKRDRYKYECEHGIEQIEPISVFDLADQWLPVAKAGASKATYNQYASIMEKMTANIGDKLVSAVTPGDIKKVWMSFVGLSQSYINKASFLYKAFFQYAIDNGYCKTNPIISQSAKPHKGTKGTHRCLTETEIRLIETVPHRVQAAAMFMLKAGLRRGEVLALKKDDIHDGRIWVTKAVKFVNNRPEIGNTKNESSERAVPLFAPLLPFIDSIQKYVLPDDDGDICSETAFTRAWESYLTDLSTVLNGEHKRWYHLTKEWKDEHPKEYIKYLELKAANKKEEAEAFRLKGWKDVSFRPHDLRHTFITKARDKGIDIHIVMNWCGHASERMILQIYDHPDEQRECVAVSMMDS